MDLISVGFSPVWQWSSFGIALPLLAWVAYTAPWRRFDAGEPVHVWCGALVAITLLWSIKASVGSEFTFHLLGVSVLTLLVGARLALPGVALVVAAATALRSGAWGSYALSVLVMGAAPVGITIAVLKAAERYLPPNLFIYFFVAAFLGSGLATLGSGLLAALLIALNVPQPLVAEHSLYLLYLAFGEATLSGMLMTMFVVYRPSWVATFDDARYLQR